MSEKLLMKGNEAVAEAAIRAGCRHFFGYPITPQTELSAYMAKRMPKIGGTFLQAESEVAAINMVLGAGAAGARVMTSSSSPGISLKSEGLSYIVGSEVPCVVMNVQRGGPGLGGIQPAQSDYFQATRGPGHGDMHLIVLAPASVQEMVDLCYDAFDLADLYRNPVMILADGMLGQMMEPVEFENQPHRELPEKSWATNGHQNRRPHNVINSLYLKAPELEAHVRDIFKKYETIREKESRCEAYLADDAEILLVAYGAAARLCKNAVKMARERGVRAGLLRPITLWPFPERQLFSYTAHTKAFLTVEMSMGQMVEDVKLASQFRAPTYFYGRTGGVIPTPEEILEQILKIAGGAR